MSELTKHYLYNLNEKPKTWYELTLYVVQWLAYSSGSIITVPLILALPLGLNQAEVAALMQRIFFYTGVATLLQVYFGYGVPMLEGPSSLWWAVIASMAVAASNSVADVFLIRGYIEFSLIASGIIVVILTKLKVFKKLEGYFTPILLGTTLVLLPLQASKMFLTGMLGVTDKGVDVFTSMTSFLVITVVILIFVKARGFVQSISVLIGIFAGWLLYVLFGKIDFNSLTFGSPFSFPEVLAWGTPGLDMGFMATQLVVSFISVVISVACIKLTLQDLGIVSEERLHKGLIISGISNILAGIGASVGTTPFATSIGLIKISRVASLLPFKIFSVILIILGFIPSVSIVIATIPAPVAYSVFVVSMGTLLCLGLKEYKKLKFEVEEALAIGISLIIGVGIISLPANVFGNMPDWISYILSNGMIVGVSCCMFLENTIKLLMKSGKAANSTPKE